MPLATLVSWRNAFRPRRPLFSAATMALWQPPAIDMYAPNSGIVGIPRRMRISTHCRRLTKTLRTTMVSAESSLLRRKGHGEMELGNALVQIIVALWELLRVLFTGLWEFLQAAFRFSLVNGLVITYIAWWLCAVNWQKLWP